MATNLDCPNCGKKIKDSMKYVDVPRRYTNFLGEEQTNTLRKYKCPCGAFIETIEFSDHPGLGEILDGFEILDNESLYAHRPTDERTFNMFVEGGKASGIIMNADYNTVQKILPKEDLKDAAIGSNWDVGRLHIVRVSNIKPKASLKEKLTRRL